MAWQTPKINWQAGDIPGASDFNRIEGNIKHFNDLLYTGWVAPSDTVILQSTTTKQPTGSALQVMKRFLVINPGRYRVKVEGRVWGGPSPAVFNLIQVRVAGFTHVFTNWSDSFSTKVFNTLYIPGGTYIDIEAKNIIGTYSYYSAVRKVQICGTLTLNRPSNSIILE